MRLWSLHPKYLDSQGLVAVWREGLLAKKVLEGGTKGYKQHPQLDRFKQYKRPLVAINHFLREILKEASKRGYRFDGTKIDGGVLRDKIKVREGQVRYEFKHLLRKLYIRDRERYKEIKKLKQIEVQPMFKVVKGEVEVWEKTR